MNQYQTQPPVRSGRPARRTYRTYVTRFVVGLIFLIPAVALAWLAFDMAGYGTEGGLGSGDTEGAGFTFMIALCPGGMAFVFFVAGLVAMVRAKSRRPPAQP